MNNFRTLLCSILSNLPLTLSDSTDPVDVSWNRVAMTIEFIFVILLSPPLLGVTLVFYPQYYPQLFEMWKPMLVAYGVHLGINGFKKR